MAHNSYTCELSHCNLNYVFYFEKFPPKYSNFKKPLNFKPSHSQQDNYGQFLEPIALPDIINDYFFKLIIFSQSASIQRKQNNRRDARQGQ